MQYYKKLIVFSSALLVTFVTVTGALRTHTPSRNNANQLRESQIPTVDYDRATNTNTGGKRHAKGKKYNKDSSVVSPELVKVTEVYHWPPNLPALPVSQSDVVIVGKVADAKAYLSSDETGVYSEFTVRVEHLLKTKNTILLRTGESIVVEREGGRVRYPSGHITQFSIAGLGMPQIGHRYLFFIKGDEDNNEIITAFELHGGKVIPLDRSGVVNFDKYRDSDETLLLNEVRTAILSN
ncbi:MAG TPA: hypothetical protein VM934_05485 [Pyrinomonadaceae bacterium]|jgi:hypothetical protein|nr:hypothetical protein [Pyrinomonadaceae bacterium]